MSEESPSERRHSRTRQAILDAARAIINEQGIDALSMRTLADKVDYSPSALYNYFKGKEEIVDALRAMGWALAATMQRRVSHDLPPVEQFYQKGLAYLKFAETYPDYYLLLMSPSDNVPGSVEEFFGRPDFGKLVDDVEQVVASGGLKLPPGYTPLHFAFFVWFLVHGIAMLKLTIMRDCQPEFDEISKQVMHGLLETLSGD
jgi:AcrR family transcriptional regulator